MAGWGRCRAKKERRVDQASIHPTTARIEREKDASSAGVLRGRLLRRNKAARGRRGARLRLVGGEVDRHRALGEPIKNPTDPRWVLAVRTAELLEGDVLGPERRDQLQRLGAVLGLPSFSVSLVIAIVQDQARRGYVPSDCPTAGEPQLRMVALPVVKDRSRAICTACSVAALLAIELLTIHWWLFR